MKIPFVSRALAAVVLGALLLSSPALTLGADPAPRQYAVDREAQVTHLNIDVTPDFARRTIAGTTAIRFKPVALPLTELKLDAGNLKVQTVTATAELKTWRATDDAIYVTFTQPVPAAKEVTVTVTYSTEPKRGIFFRTPEMGYKEGEAHLFSQGEESDNRFWYPAIDAPNQLATSEVTCRVPEGMTVVSNGRLVSQEKGTNGLVAFHWSQEKPHANYLVSLVAGYFEKVEDKYLDVPLTFYTLPSEIRQARSSLRNTSDMMAFFEVDTGMRYPWAKYAQVCVNDFVAGGMENTSATTLTDSTLFTDATENIHESEPLVAHELAHQWFGDLVTCKDWSQTWLNEGFATYYETLYSGHKDGRDSMLYELRQRVRQLSSNRDERAIVRRDFGNSGEMFSHLSYAKGGMVLHMLRCELGDDLFRQCVKAYLEKFQYGNVDTEDFRKVIEQITGRTYDRFFDQWVYHGHCPELDIDYSWDEAAKAAKVTIKQTQELNDKVLLFQVPLTLRFKVNGKVEDRTVQVTRKQEDFTFPLAAAPEFLLPDPEVALLAKIKYTLTESMVTALLGDTNQVVGRLWAIHQIAEKKEGANIARLQKALNDDPFYGVRLEASQGLRSIHKDDAQAALVASVAQADARVRRQVIADLMSFHGDKVYEVAQKVVQSEKNPDIAAIAIRALGEYHKPEVRPTLTGLLNSESYHNELADAAIDGLRKQENPADADLLMETLQRRAKDFTRAGMRQGLETVAYLARNAENKDRYREFLAGYVEDKRRGMRVAAVNALATLGDTKAISTLEAFAKSAGEDAERTTAEKAVQTLRAANDKEKALNEQIAALKKSNEELQKELAGLKQAATPVAGATATGPVASTAAASSAPTVPAGRSNGKRPALRSPKMTMQLR